MRDLILEKKVAKFLTFLKTKDLLVAKRLVIKIKELQYEPSGGDTKALTNTNNYRRARVGKYRIVYKYDDEKLYIILIGKRDEIYKQL